MDKHAHETMSELHQRKAWELNREEELRAELADLHGWMKKTNSLIESVQARDV